MCVRTFNLSHTCIQPRTQHLAIRNMGTFGYGYPYRSAFGILDWVPLPLAYYAWMQEARMQQAAVETNPSETCIYLETHSSFFLPPLLIAHLCTCKQVNSARLVAPEGNDSWPAPCTYINLTDASEDGQPIDSACSGALHFVCTHLSGATQSPRLPPPRPPPPEFHASGIAAHYARVAALCRFQFGGGAPCGRDTRRCAGGCAGLVHGQALLGRSVSHGGLTRGSTGHLSWQSRCGCWVCCVLCGCCEWEYQGTRSA